MATKYIRFKGKLLWPGNLFVPDTPPFEGAPASYKANLIPEGDSMKAFKESGIRTAIQKDKNTGDEYIVLKRNKDPKVLSNGDQIGGGAPRVVDAEGNPWPREVAIGNGSEVEVLVTTFKGGSFTGHRLEEVVIRELVPYVNDKAREVAEEPAAPKNPKDKARIPF